MNSNGDMISGYAIENAADPKVEVKNTDGYDNDSELTSYTSNYYVDDVIQPAFAISTTYKYDKKNAIVYKNMLPLWYFRAYEICGKKYYIVNNVTESEDLEGRTGKTNYTYTYNDENYPVEFYTQNLTGEPLPMTTFKVTYKTVQVEVKK